MVLKEFNLGGNDRTLFYICRLFLRDAALLTKDIFSSEAALQLEQIQKKHSGSFPKS